MTDSRDSNPELSELRRRAEDRLREKEGLAGELSPTEAARLIHELQVHQIELELQNEELRQAQARLEESRSRYSDLYDFAPLGYLTLDERGMIVEANLTAASLLGLERGRLLGRFFPMFLVEGERPTFRRLLSNFLNQPEQRGEFHLKDGSGQVRTMLLNLLFLRDAQGRERRRLTLTDITGLKQAQEALEESQIRLRQLTEQLLIIQELERQRIARDLHDELGQSLMALKMQLNAVKRSLRRGQEAWGEFDRVLDFINEIAAQTRDICQSLRPSVLENLGLTGALRHLLIEFQKHHGLEVSQEMEEVSPPLSPGAQIAVYRIFQECLTNATRHGQATRVRIRIRSEKEGVSFLIEDNGSGFDPAEVGSRQDQGLGLAAMEERIRLLQGSFKVTSARGRGTRVAFTLPPSP